MNHVRVHFVYLGRSRIATAAAMYLRTLVNKTWRVSATTIQHYPRENDVTLQQALDESHIIICMGKHTFNELEKRFTADARKIMVWHEDKYTPEHITKRCGELATYLQQGSWIDVTNRSGVPTGLILPVSWVCDRGYWQRGVHIVLMTRSGGAVLEIRSKDIITNPGMLDVTLGGFVDAGEEPVHAAIRELKEELGILLPADTLHLIDVRERGTWHPKRHTYSRTILYTYMAVVDETEIIFRPEFSEVAGIVVCTRRHLRELLHGKRVPGLGRITSSLAYYNDVVRLAHQKLKILTPSRRQPRKTVQ